MKTSLTKLLALAIWLPSLILITISGYFLYTNYIKYTQTQKSLKYLTLAKKMENMLIYLGQERGVSSIYSVSKGEYPNSKELLHQKRVLFSNAINDFEKYVNKHPEFNKITQPIISLLNKLPIVRKNIDTFKDNYIKNEFFTYYTTLENQILNSESKIFKYFPIELKHYYVLKTEFNKMISYSGITRGFGAYYITADKPISQKEYQNVLMKYYHDTNILLTNLLNKNEIKKYNSKKFKEIEKQIKETLFYIQQANQEYYLTGQFEGYPIDSLDYFNLFTQRINYFKNTVNNINNIIDKKTEIIIKNALLQRNISIVIFLLAIFILIIGYYINKAIVTHIKSLSNLLSSLTPIIGKKTTIDITTAEGLNKALKTVDEAIKITQESIKKSEEAAKAKSLFLANMSHEIRTPLNGILGFLELLNTTDLTEEQIDYINTISQSAKNLLQIVNNILDVSKIESNKVSLEIIDFKAIDEFENTLELFATPAAQKNIEFVTEISPNIPSIIKGDILKIKEILRNLVSNAIKFTPDNGTISVKIKLEEIINNKAKIYFEVKDTGIGMSEEQKEKVFDAFSQADESITRKYGGTGLGLSIVKSYIEMMGGKINVESELNKGTKFYFELNFDIVDKIPKYSNNIFATKEIAILNTKKETLRKEVTLEYLSYFGVEKIGVNSIEEINVLSNREKFDGLLIFYEESDLNIIQDINKINIPTIFITSYSKKEEISKFNYDFVIFDPNMPSKIYKTLDSLNQTKIEKEIQKESKTEIKDIYSLRSLIAEDNPINQKLLQTTLKQLGIESEIANNGLEAFNKYSMNPNKYDVIFMDIQMPIMDGLEATQEILEFEKEEELPHTPIIAVTANVLKGDREKFMGAGMDEYISKPISKDALLKILERVAHGDFKKQYHINKIDTENSKEIKDNNKINKTLNSSNDKSKVILATSSKFLSSYFQQIIPDIILVNSIDKLTKTLSTQNNIIIILDENFVDNENIKNLINNLKKLHPNKIIVISDNKIEEADVTIIDLKPDNITKVIKG